MNEVRLHDFRCGLARLFRSGDKCMDAKCVAPEAATPKRASNIKTHHMWATTSENINTTTVSDT